MAKTVRAAEHVASELSASQEDYLEAIFELLAEQPFTRVRDIMRRLGVSAPSVTVALRTLAARGLVRYEPHEYVTLTAEGHAAAHQIARRHRILRDFFIDALGADPLDAERCACRMEHVISRDLFERLCTFIENWRRSRLERRPPSKP